MQTYSSTQATLIPIFLLLTLPVGTFSHASIDIRMLLAKMQAAYARINDYQANVEVKEFTEGNGPDIQRFLYTFKKPNLIRIDLQAPHSGTVLIYPDKEGKIIVWRPGLPHYLALHLSPDSQLLRKRSGQRIDQTDLGLLIANIARSLADPRSAVHTDEDGSIRIQLLAPDHFKQDIMTFYSFWIDRKMMLPVRVMEATPGGIIKRTVIFRNLRLNIGVPLEAFQLG